jgi:Skp family chaperone for outer membrane proteins
MVWTTVGVSHTFRLVGPDFKKSCPKKEFWMRHFGVFFALTSAVVGVTGCGQMSGQPASSSRGGMAVVDLDKVAAETGRDRQLAQSLELAQHSLNQSYAKKVESARDQLNEKKKGYGEELSDDEKKEFTQMARSAETQLSQIQNMARQEFEQYKQGQIAKFRAELKPITQEIAAKRGLSIVIPKNEGLLLSVDPGVDITDDVVKVLRERHPVPAPVTAPAATSAAAAAPKSSSPTRSASSAKTATPARTADAGDDEEPIR